MGGLKYCTLLAGILLGGSILSGSSIYAQEKAEFNSTTYQVEMFGSAATGENTPFLMISNRYGTVPLDAGNGYARGRITHSRTLGKGFYWGAGLDAIVVAPRYRNVYIQQLYAEVGYRAFALSVGSKERYRSIYNRDLSSGDMIQSANARPYPEISIYMPAFTVVPYTKGWFQIKGDFGVGRSFDSEYLKKEYTKAVYIDQILWHRKAFFGRIQDTHGNKPLFFIFGLQHLAQWGGTSTDPKTGRQPQSFTDLIRVILGRSGGEDASLTDQINVLGNHAVSYDLKLGFRKERWQAEVYYQHLSFDKSGLELYNGIDGLWGIHVGQDYFPWVRNLLVEYIYTKNQSGSFHFIDFDHEAHPGRGNGGDDYYNNLLYTNGNAYFGQAVGNPLLTSPIYNRDGRTGFRNSRIKDWHIGMDGEISGSLSYRMLLTFMQGWGTPYAPFLEKKSGSSFLLDITYSPRRLKGWEFTGTGAFDAGNTFGSHTAGISIGIRKTGVIKFL